MDRNKKKGKGLQKKHLEDIIKLSQHNFVKIRLNENLIYKNLSVKHFALDLK